MHVSDYRNLMQAEGRNPEEKTDKKKGAFDKATMAFRHDLACGKIVWEGHWCWDLWHYFKNNHELLSLFKAPKAHPFSRKERMVVLSIQLTLNSVIALVNGLVVPEGDDVTNSAFAIYLAIVGGVISMISNKILTCSATCGCVQNSKTNKRKCCETCGHCFMCIYGLAVIGFCGLLWYAAVINGVDGLGFALSYAVTTGTSWVTSVFWLMSQYCWSACKERRAMEKDEPKYMKKKKYYVSYRNQKKYWEVHPKKGKGKKSAAATGTTIAQPQIQFCRPVYVVGPDGTPMLVQTIRSSTVPAGFAGTHSMQPMMVASPANPTAMVQRAGTMVMVQNQGTRVNRTGSMVVQGMPGQGQSQIVYANASSPVAQPQGQVEIVYAN